MSVYAKSRAEQLKEVRYVAGQTIHYGAAKQHQIRIPGLVSVKFGDGSLELDIEDAHALMFGLAVALVQDAAALRESAAGPKAVA
ncbi:hypothetical protein GPX89_19755 [Nocardia sp. ET3-3]|uniref:Uncharacterized protein n=1 Tax=Nocardia terrae TaxID=2675851 RepID=A0A7K1UYY1_9NOCA|nr:hypothetical protein [Nocardia terrae]MVU79471.1 hypothetical protein [Nocardia terrae]